MDSVVLDKSKAFALRIVRLNQYLCAEKQEYVMSKQILRSGTSIGANLAESEYAISRKEFLSKVYISLKECAETKYWLELLHEAGYLDATAFESIVYDCVELLKILTAITKTIKENP